MASNTLPYKRDLLFTLCEEMCDGLHNLETTLGVKQNTEAVLRAALAASRASELAFGNSVLARREATAALQEADNAGRVFISNSRKRLTKFFGESYDSAWGAAGFPDNSTAVPQVMAERFALLHALKSWFTLHPEHESPDMDATAAIADTLITAIVAARDVLAERFTQSGIAKNARDAAEANLRKRASGLVQELSLLLSDEDSRWHRFGLSRPADEETPEAPTVTNVTPANPGMLLVTWNSALRADHYRVWTQVVGTDTDFKPVISPSDNDATLTGLASGATVKVRVTSVNGAGESQPGPVATTLVS